MWFLKTKDQIEQIRNSVWYQSAVQNMCLVPCPCGKLLVPHSLPFCLPGYVLSIWLDSSEYSCLHAPFMCKHLAKKSNFFQVSHLKERQEYWPNVSEPVTGWRSVHSIPVRGHCVVFLGKTLNSRSPSLQPGVKMCTSKCNAGGWGEGGGNFVLSHLVGCRNTPSLRGNQTWVLARREGVVKALFFLTTDLPQTTLPHHKEDQISVVQCWYVGQCNATIK